MLQHPLLENVIAWAQAEEPIRALVVTGSLARADGSADQYSDLDAQIITDDITRYTGDDSWLDTLGEVWIRFPLYQDVPYRLVWFADGIKVDFQFITIDSIRTIIKSATLSEEYQRGYQVLLDKDGLYRQLPPSPRRFPPAKPPSPEALHAAINEFWFEAIHVAQFIRRRQFWVVKFRDWTMKSNLLQLLEWHARVIHQAPNTWLLGKHIDRWTDEQSYAAIKKIWAPWDGAELWDSLLLQLALFRRLSRELSNALGYPYAEETYQEIEAYIQRLRQEDSGAGARG